MIRPAIKDEGEERERGGNGNGGSCRGRQQWRSGVEGFREEEEYKITCSTSLNFKLRKNDEGVKQSFSLI